MKEDLVTSLVISSGLVISRHNVKLSQAKISEMRLKFFEMRFGGMAKNDVLKKKTYSIILSKVSIDFRTLCQVIKNHPRYHDNTSRDHR